MAPKETCVMFSHSTDAALIGDFHLAVALPHSDTFKNSLKNKPKTSVVTSIYIYQLLVLYKRNINAFFTPACSRDVSGTGFRNLLEAEKREMSLHLAIS